MQMDLLAAGGLTDQHDGREHRGADDRGSLHVGATAAAGELMLVLAQLDVAGLHSDTPGTGAWCRKLPGSMQNRGEDTAMRTGMLIALLGFHRGNAGQYARSGAWGQNR
ncbi:hypothetical protein TspCOW1_30140 [Thiohalobacter sp. COW1]|uniref:DNA/RNA helicases n=1 Tax=Thiohalobacter thiocyanaticus TaxID=585455 RepID=A0A1Z4VU44_9GAMM|nr:DNA/RNA helicases [Thiohalobacter thiocyanaticus]BCO32911.1 hypothetical protein TspCOW1_30140 [Thiohalobacter sp. COW1]